MRLDDYEVKRVSEIYLEDIPYILHPDQAISHLELSLNLNPKSYDSPFDLFGFDHALISDLKDGNRVLVNSFSKLNDLLDVLDHKGSPQHDLPLFLKLHLDEVISQQIKRPVSRACYLSVFPLNHIKMQHEDANQNVNKKQIEINSHSIKEMLLDPTLDSIYPIIDPVSMLADDIRALIEDGIAFVKDPSFSAAAKMAITAIPGKIADDITGQLLKEAIERNPLKQIKNRKILNSDMAGKTVKTKGGEVWFDFDGFPDFTPYAQKIVRIEGLTGVMSKDVPLAIKKAGLTEYDNKNNVWHHHQDGMSMMLVPRNVHSHLQGGISHSGGRAIIVHNIENPDNILKYPSPNELF